jgi:hypothetical protein
LRAQTLIANKFMFARVRVCGLRIGPAPSQARRPMAVRVFARRRSNPALIHNAQPGGAQPLLARVSIFYFLFFRHGGDKREKNDSQIFQSPSHREIYALELD